MLNVNESLINSDKVVRKAIRECNEDLIDQLIREDLDLEEKNTIVELIKETLAKNDEFEERNSEFWYKHGCNNGEIKGMLKAAGAMTVGFLIGIIIKR